MRVLGIDPGYATIGYGVIDTNGNKHKVVDYGVITTPKEENIAVRLAMIYDSMTAVIEKFKPDEIAVEELFFVKNITTGINVAHARGIILLASVHACGKLYEYTPLQIKQAMTGYGRAEKHQVMEMVKNLLKLNAVPKPDDTADALALAICHGHTSGSVYNKYKDVR